jgi:alpha-L-rhamnosidase
LLAFLAGSAAAAIRVGELRCEYLREPVGLDVPQPRLSWEIASSQRAAVQLAYRVLVASSPQLLEEGIGDLWDSGKVCSSESIQVVYGGRPLTSGAACWWKVCVWTGSDTRPGWSKASRWTMGLLAAEDWKGSWIGEEAASAQAQGPLPAPFLRKTFQVKKPILRATVYLCGLGYHELYLNGRKVGDAVLEPRISQYDKRVIYLAHDVTRQLIRGHNALGVVLGNSWYNVTLSDAWNFDKAPWRAQPEMLLQLNLEFADGTRQEVVSDGSWKMASGPILFDQTRVGERYDARRELAGWAEPSYDDTRWGEAAPRQAPPGKLCAANVESIKVVETVLAKSVREVRPGVFVFDLGQNITGWPALRVRGPAGTEVRLSCSDMLNSNGTVNLALIGKFVRTTNFQTDFYILKGKGLEKWEPRFTFHGFQYVQVEGWPGTPGREAVVGRVVHTAFEPAGEFECSDKLINQIERAAVWSYRGNFVGFPTDCPHREKNGWTGDAQLAVRLGLEHFRAEAAYGAWLRDLAAAQRADGKLPCIVPTAGWGYNLLDGPAWESVFLLIPWEMYLQSGDRRLLEENYDGFKRWLEWYRTKTTNGIVEYGLGDWCPAKSKTAANLTSTAYYFRALNVMAAAAGILGRTADAEMFCRRAEATQTAFNRRFFHAESGLYGEGTQTALAVALAEGLVPQERQARVAANLEAAARAADYHIDTGILGARCLLRALSDNGYAESAWKIARQTSAPGWGNWIARGATTLWEDWPGLNSRNHIMFGDISSWFMEYLAGIRYVAEAPGYRQVLIRPILVSGLASARASRHSPYGPIQCEWRRGETTLRLKVRVPPNTTARIILPCVDASLVKENGKPVASATGVSSVRIQEQGLEVCTGSGTYDFSLPVAALH